MPFSKDFWQKLLRIADKNAPSFRKVVEEAVQAMTAGVATAELESSLGRKDANAAENALAWETFKLALEGLKTPIARVVEAAGTAVADEISTTAGATFRFDLINPHSVAWIEAHSADLVREIEDSTRLAIREVIRDGFTEGITPQQSARRIMEHIGLDSRRSRALTNYRSSLLEEGVPAGKVDEMCERYAGKLLRSRARTIAFNESLEGSAQGSYLSTRQAVERGVLDPRIYEAYRIVTPDDRLCDRCRPLAGEVRQLPDGVYQSTGSKTARVHTLCRCVEGIRRI